MTIHRIHMPNSCTELLETSFKQKYYTLTNIIQKSLLFYQTATLTSRLKGLQIQPQRNSQLQTMLNQIRNHLWSSSVILCRKWLKVVSSKPCKVF